MLLRLFVFLTALFLCLGCGGSLPNSVVTSNNPPQDQEGLSGRVQSPQPGFPLSSLSVGSALSSAKVGDDGSFVLKAQADGQLIFIFDSNDNVVYAAFQDGGQTVGPRSTAQVALFFGAGGFALPANLQVPLRQQILALPELDALESAIRSSLNRQVGGLVDDPLVAAALRSALESMSRRVNSMSGTANRLLIQPSNGQSGLELREVGSNSISATNSLRRPAWAFVSKISSKSQEGETTVFSPPVPLTDLSIPAVKGAVNFTSTATDAASVLFGWDAGPVAGVPVSTDPVNLPTDGAANVRYSVEIVGPGLQTPSPTNDAQRSKLQELTLNYAGEIVLNFLVNTVLNVPAVGNKFDTFSSTSDFSILVNDFIKLMVSLKPEIADKAAVGDVDGVLKGLYDAVLVSGTSQALIYNFVIQRLAPALGKTVSGEVQEEYFEKIRGFMRAMGGVDLILSSTDTAFAGASMASASRLVTFDVQAIESQVKLTPLNPTLQQGDEQQFVARVPSITLEGSQFFEYRWTCTGNAGTLRSPANGAINNFTTSQSTGPVYKADGEGESDLITVTVTLVELNQRTEIGSASTTVTVETTDNLLVNGDFSDGINGWSPLPGTNTPINPSGPYPWFLPTSVVYTIPNNGEGAPFASVHSPFSAGGFRQTVTLPADGTYTLTYLGLGQYDPVSVNTRIVSNDQTLVEETFTPPPAIADVSTNPWILTGADWSRRSLTFTGEEGASVSVVVNVSNSSSGINGTIALFDNFVLSKD